MVRDAARRPALVAGWIVGDEGQTANLASRRDETGGGDRRIETARHHQQSPAGAGGPFAHAILRGIAQAAVRLLTISQLLIRGGEGPGRPELGAGGLRAEAQPRAAAHLLDAPQRRVGAADVGREHVTRERIAVEAANRHAAVDQQADVRGESGQIGARGMKAGEPAERGAHDNRRVSG